MSNLSTLRACAMRCASVLTVCLAIAAVTPAQGQSGPGAAGWNPDPVTGDIGMYLAGNRGNFFLHGDMYGMYGSYHHLSGALGLHAIDDEIYLSLRFQPELTFGKFGVGLDIPLSYNLASGKLRTEEYEDGVAWLRIIRYLRYGRKKQDPLYAKVGDIYGTTLGAGFMVYRYANRPAFEKRPIGSEFDINLDRNIGLEGFYSDFSQSSTYGMRIYARPFALMDSSAGLPGLLEVGALYAADPSAYAGPGGKQLSMWGLDAALPIALTSFLTITPYAAFAAIIDPEDDVLDSYAREELGLTDFSPGSGTALGLNFDLLLSPGVFEIAAKLERRFYGDYFAGSYFDALYESNKLAASLAADSLTILPAIHPLNRLLTARAQHGTFGALYGNLFNIITLGGSLQIPDKLVYVQQADATDSLRNGAVLHLEARTNELMSLITFGASYDRDNIRDVEDAFVLDERSVLNAIALYNLGGPWRVGLHYRWTFARIDGEVEARSSVFPFVAVNFNLD